MKLKEALEKKKFVVTSEIQPPIDEKPEEIIKRLELVRGRVNGITVPELDIEGIVADTVKTCELLKQNRMMFFHVDAGKLDSVLDHLRKGYTVDGKDLPFKAEFTFGSGVESKWGKNIPELELKEMEEMINKGTGYFLTTPIFDVGLFEKFMKQVNTFGVPVIAEVMILRTAGMGQFLNRHLQSGLVPDWIIKKMAKAPDKQKSSIEIFTDIVSGLRDLCQGVHIITIGAEDKLRYYLDAAKIKKLY